MDNDTNEYLTEKEKQEQKLEALLLEGLESGEPTPLTHLDFDEIKNRVAARLKAKSDNQKAV